MVDQGSAMIAPLVVGSIAAATTGAALVAVRLSLSLRRGSIARRQLQLSTQPTAERFDSIRLPPRVLCWLDSAELSFGDSVPMVTIGTGIVSPAILVVIVGPVAAAGAIALVSVVAVMTVVARQGMADRRYESDLPDAVDQVVRALRSGTSLARALAESAHHTDRQLAVDLEWLSRVSPTTTLEQRLARWPDRRPIAAVRLVAAALSLGHESGAGQSAALEGAAESLRVRLDTHAELRSQSVQSRMSAVVIAVAPVGFLALTALIDPRVPRFLLDTTPGRVSLLAGLTLDVIAAAMMVRLTSRVVD